MDWEEAIRTPSPRDLRQEKIQVRIRPRQQGNEVCILCVSEGLEAKDRAMREEQERLKQDLEALQTRVGKGRLKKTETI